MGVRRTSGVDSRDDVEDSDALRRVGVRGPTVKDVSCPNEGCYVIGRSPIFKELRKSGMEKKRREFLSEQWVLK